MCGLIEREIYDRFFLNKFETKFLEIGWSSFLRQRAF